jgi:hypothetical protein
VYEFRQDAGSGKLTAAGKVPAGTGAAGPRHLAFHPSQDVAFTADGTASSITAYRFDRAGGLTPLQALPTVPAGFKGRNTAAEVRVHPDGQFAWVANRGHDSLAGFAIGADGEITALGQTPAPKGLAAFDLSGDGLFLLAAGSSPGKLAVYKVDLGTGELTQGQTYDVGKAPACVRATWRSFGREVEPIAPGPPTLPKGILDRAPEAPPREERLHGFLGLIQMLAEHPGTTLLGVVIVVPLIWLVLFLCKKVKWLNKEM